jgi:hypothetical protein
MCWQPIDLLFVTRDIRMQRWTVCVCVCVYIITNIHEIFEVVNTKVFTVVASQSKIHGLYYPVVNISRTVQTT